ncbi:hypothetical protein TRVL_09774 [Trypanosoma vivax]|nr:hypothetical protein TRVL_09774 [Trypanosoma vivax]
MLHSSHQHGVGRLFGERYAVTFASHLGEEDGNVCTLCKLCSSVSDLLWSIPTIMTRPLASASATTRIARWLRVPASMDTWRVVWGSEGKKEKRVCVSTWMVAPHGIRQTCAFRISQCLSAHVVSSHLNEGRMFVYWEWVGIGYFASDFARLSTGIHVRVGWRWNMCQR